MTRSLYPRIPEDKSESSSTRMSVAYLNSVLDILSQSRSLGKTSVEVAKQTGYAAAGTISGGLLLGPLGALVGGILGATYGYLNSSEYESLLTCIRMMTDEEKEQMGRKVQGLVGAVSISEFIKWVQDEGHRALVIGVLADMAKSYASK